MVILFSFPYASATGIAVPFKIITPLDPRLKGFSRVCELVLELRHCSLASPACIYSLPVGTVETDHKAYYGARSRVRAAYELSACIHLPTEARAHAQTLCHPPHPPKPHVMPVTWFPGKRLSKSESDSYF